MPRLIEIYSIELVKGIKVFPIENTSLINISYVFLNNFELGISVHFSWEIPLHIGLTIGLLNIYVQFFGVDN
jgi:hypothetical protein